MDDSILDRIFSVAAAAWAAVAMLAVRLFHTWPLVMERLNERKRDAALEKAGDWERIRAERDNARAEARAAREEAQMLRALLVECERISIERLGRAVIAEAELIGLNKALGKPTVLPGSEGPSKGGNGGGK